MRAPFVGRDRQRAELLAGLDDALAGLGRLFLIAGEPGIGKTALAEHIAHHAADRGALVVWSRSWDGGALAPFWTWAQVIRSLADELDEETLISLLPADAAARLAVLVPELADHASGRVAPIGGTESDAARFELFEAITKFVTQASSARPLMLVLDDLLAGDRPSLALLRFLARDLPTSRLLVVATYRDVEAGSRSDAGDVLAELVREGHVLRLGGLHRAEVADLIARFSGVDPWEEKVTAIHAATEGNPLFVREVTRLLALEDGLDRPGRLTIRVPDSVRAVIRRRLAPLPSDAVEALSAAAVVGRDFDVALVVAASDIAAERAVASLSDAVKLGVIAEADAVGVYRFTHPLIREVIYEGLPLPARMEMHRRVGEALENLDEREPGARVTELAHHFIQVATVGHATKAVKYARAAGDRAMDSHAYEDAAVQYRRALDASRFTRPDERVHCDLLLRVGEAAVRAGGYGDAKRHFLEAAEIARRSQAPEQLARAALGFGEPPVEGGLVDRRVIDLLHEALDALGPEDSPLRARLLARFSLELTFSDDARLRDELRDKLSRDALEMADRLRDVSARALARRARWMAVWGPDGHEERAALSEELLGLARDTGDRELELIGRARRITCSMQSGDRHAADVDIAAHDALAGELRMPYHEWTATTLRAMQALLDGSFEAAEDLIERASTLLVGRENARMAHILQMTTLRWEQGRLGELHETWQEVARRFPQFGFARGWLALALAERGRRVDAARELGSLLGELDELPRNGQWLWTLATASLGTAALDDDGAARVYRLLLPYARWTIVTPVPQPVACLGSASLYLGILASELARWDDADEHFEVAIRANARLGATTFVARTEYEYARMLVRRGRAADRKRALAVLDRADRAARSLGMSPVVAGVGRLRELDAGTAVAAGEPGAAIAADRSGANAFRREGDYWTVVYAGSVARLKDSKGLRHLARLLAEPGREFHALDIEAAESPETPSGSRSRAAAEGLDTRRDLGDAGALLDDRAKAEYRGRLEELRAELDEANEFNDPERAAKIQEEIDFIAGELSRALGLGGRDRRAASHAERARLNVTRAIRAAIGNLARVNPALGRHLSSTIRTGRYCSYVPDGRDDPVWRS